MKKKTEIQPSEGPTSTRERHVILDALRGLALLGIALANFPEFGLWTFLSAEQQAAMPTAETDQWVRMGQYMLVDGKFYTIFSLLFGIGFSLILMRHSRWLFFRRMLILVLIGFLHLMFIWNGDILLLYAIGGLLLMLFVNLPDKALLCTAILLILLPIGLDALTEFRGVDFSGPFYQAWWSEAKAQGITEDNFASWLRDAQSYPEMFAFLRQGALERMWEFVDGHRLPKVVGLFIIGYLIGKRKLYARLEELPLKELLRCILLLSLVLSYIYAWSATNGHPWGLTAHSALYALSVVPLGLCYVIGFCLLYARTKKSSANSPSLLFTHLAAPGRMALTNYIGQSLIGILLFYGIGGGLGTRLGLVHIELIAVGVFILQIPFSLLWLRYFRFGPLEWIWRMLTYGHWLRLKK